MEPIRSAVLLTEYPRIPWRRMFARGIDLMIISSIRLAILSLVFRVNVALFGDLVDFLFDILDWIILIPIEALLLSRFGTTPGKWLWGIRVGHVEGRRLTFREAARRSFGVLRYGEGFLIPIYGIIRNYKSYKSVMDGRPTEWDEDCTVTLRDEKPWRIAAYIGVQLAMIVVMFAVMIRPMLPPNRGELTVDEFVENYNYLAEQHGHDRRTLLPDGSFTSSDYQRGNAAIDLAPTNTAPLTLITDEAGILTEVSFAAEGIGHIAEVLSPDQRREAWLATMALAWADADPYSAYFSASTVDDLLEKNNVNSLVCGCRVSFDAELDQTDFTFSYTFRIAVEN